MQSSHDRPVVLLSPHLDDAVFGLWHVLDGPGSAEVVTVFAGIPDPGRVTPLDASHGAEESAAWMRRRRREDREALAVAGRDPRHLDLLDIQYVADRDPELAQAVAEDPDSFVRIVRDRIDLRDRVSQIAEALPPDALRDRLVHAPVGFGGHPDHRAVALYAVELAKAGAEVRLWGDSPYVVRHGLPTWLGGVHNPPADEIVAEGLAATVGDRYRLTVDTVRLTGAALERKLRATRCYRTEYPSIQADFGAAMEPDMLAYELVWSLRADDQPGRR
ncbi:PIG-L family deacetylase [Streptomyces cinnabarinus]|uniref:PIG-L family deacetylase n=1 Tax=Streptomyces cinnabarinus TaxID=67287 RepID=A0ABY7KQE9_9ACTN|nr:PIG-L family deacetylase [Streptomyces cinnabarinus]WAZ25312.1 PIG-L family deacetylase [Streptomyces cinnabarinus]